MPNWCFNTIKVEGNPRAVQRFAKAVHTSIAGEVNLFDFNAIIPCPKELLGDEWQSDEKVAAANKEKYGFTGWYDWNVENWGTKWNSSEVRKANGDKAGTLIYDFDTAWSPVSDKIMLRLSTRFPSLTITQEWHEEACMYPSARKVWKDGVVVSEEIQNTFWSEEEESVENE